ncbi:MAG: hypothetical protein LBR35_00400 [Rickettsiales bacterium]|jgi:hypothetical protein|nr:hypothetical protein [Rickettsiales bacterium]
MKKYLLACCAIFYVFGAKAANLENPMYMTSTGNVYVKALAEFPSDDGTDAVFAEEFGFGLTKGIMVYQKMGFSIGDKVEGQSQFLSDLVLGANFRVINSSYQLDILTRYEMNASKKYARGSVYDDTPSSYGESDNNMFLGIRAGKKIKESILVVGRIGYDYYFNDPKLGNVRFESPDVSSLDFGFEIAFQLTNVFSMNFSIDRFEHGHSDFDKTAVGLKLNYNLNSGMIVSGYAVYDAEQEDDEMTFGAKFGYEF